MMHFGHFNARMWQNWDHLAFSITIRQLLVIT